MYTGYRFDYGEDELGTRDWVGACDLRMVLADPARHVLKIWRVRATCLPRFDADSFEAIAVSTVKFN
jgi:hypothetical protein